MVIIFRPEMDTTEQITVFGFSAQLSLKPFLKMNECLVFEL